MNGPQAWPGCDEDIKQFIMQLAERLKQGLGERLTGIYLHGSLAMGSYYRPKSDFDLIVVVDRRLEADLAEAVGVAVAGESARRPTTGNIELSVITAETAKRLPIPTPYEVHYSTTWHHKILNREVDYSLERTDADLASHLTYVGKRGICLYGRPIADTFGLVPRTHFMNAVLDDFEWIVEDEHIVESPYYGILNICRVLRLFSEEGEAVHSKDEGGEWGLERLPADYHPLIRQALDIYRSSEAVTEEDRKTGGKRWERAELLSFRDFARAARQSFGK